ncbi:MAG TPA: hypothetical protein VL854_02520 [Nitrososphaeraceae archaeon]|nr:hypothetical protein [Nitrososphaeraceae archaeon]
MNSVDQFYEENIYQDALNEFTEDDITKMVKKSARELARRL